MAVWVDSYAVQLCSFVIDLPGKLISVHRSKIDAGARGKARL